MKLRYQYLNPSTVIEMRQSSVNSNNFTYVLISRRSCFRAGTRYYMRGLDQEGHAANFVETEQIVEIEGYKSSFVQVRWSLVFNTLRPRQDGRHFADDIFTCIFFNENCCILIKFSLKYVRKGPIDNNPALVQIMVWRRSGDKPLSEPMMIRLPTHICVTRPQWVMTVWWLW